MACQGEWGQMAAVRGNRIVSVPLDEAVGELKNLTKKSIACGNFLRIAAPRFGDRVASVGRPED